MTQAHEVHSASLRDGCSSSSFTGDGGSKGRTDTALTRCPRERGGGSPRGAAKALAIQGPVQAHSGLS